MNKFFIAITLFFVSMNSYAEDFSSMANIQELLPDFEINRDDLYFLDNGRITLNSKDWAIEKGSIYNTSLVDGSKSERIRMDSDSIMVRTLNGRDVLYVSKDLNGKPEFAAHCVRSIRDNGETCFQTNNQSCEMINDIFNSKEANLKMVECAELYNKAFNYTKPPTEPVLAELKKMGVKNPHDIDKFWETKAGYMDTIKMTQSLINLCQKIKWAPTDIKDTKSYILKNNKKLNYTPETK